MITPKDVGEEIVRTFQINKYIYERCSNIMIMNIDLLCVVQDMTFSMIIIDYDDVYHLNQEETQQFSQILESPTNLLPFSLCPSQLFFSISYFLHIS